MEDEYYLRGIVYLPFVVVSIGFGDSAHQFHAALRYQGRARFGQPVGPRGGTRPRICALGIYLTQ
jgi:hypothetical protein